MKRLQWLIVAMICLVANAASAQSYPNKPVRLIVPFGPGSGSDIVARRLGAYLQKTWKQQVVIDNRPGAQGVIGTNALKNAAADGYTLGISTNSTHAAAPYLVRNLSYDPINDFAHIAVIGAGGSVALVSRQSGFKTIPELAAYAKAHPNTVFFGHADTIAHVSGELFKARAGVPIQGVPYKTSSSVITDLIGGHIQIAFFNYMTGAAQIASGRLIPIAITEPKRDPRWPDVPTMEEYFPGLEVSFFIGVSAPAGIPADIAAQIHRALQDAQKDPGFREPLEATGVTLIPQSPGEYRAFIVREAGRWREHVREARLLPQ